METPIEIVGIVGHVAHWGLDSDSTNPIRQEMYFPVQQIPDAFAIAMVASFGAWEEGPGYRRLSVQPVSNGVGFTLLSNATIGVTFTNHISEARVRLLRISRHDSSHCLRANVRSSSAWSGAFPTNVSPTNSV